MAKMTPAQQDTAFLAAERSTVTTGTDADVIAAGRGVCADVAAGVTGTPITDHIVARGFTASDAFSIQMLAGLSFCPKP
ncbi:DUF732 domain-containing protein [Cryobacterium sp. RTS3]|uniref:DUF732 domain-containing protein n=1 Tax=Cryobacterium sp. RTS3 TaxID=3048643 RepID=UPI002B2373DA|nr:DUF732 domain-containing protein [Cryobacterium sp. RTS3]MEA9997834.1 DUF732 domain-containing protein [Cryobacterium sp. RTS3]